MASVEKKSGSSAGSSSTTTYTTSSNGRRTTYEAIQTTITTHRSTSVSSSVTSSELSVNNLQWPHTETNIFLSPSLPNMRALNIAEPNRLDANKRSSFAIESLLSKRDAVPFTTPYANNSSPVPSPVPKVTNLNYQSPYRNSPVYSSLKTSLSKNNPVATSSSPLVTKNPILSRSTPSAYVLPTVSTPIAPKPVVTKPTEIPLKVKNIEVKKTGKRYDRIPSTVPVYSTSSKKRGEALIINNIMFKSNEYRDGAAQDEKNLEKLFKQLGFTVKTKRDQKKTDMKSALKNFSKSSSLKTVDISVVIVMSHGTNHNRLGGYTEIFGVDDEGLSTDEILEFFSSDKCSYMAKKPKIFIFQCCRGNNEDFVKTDAKPIQARKFEDMLIAYSTLPGFSSNRDPVHGTWYIQTICDVFSRHAHENHVEDLLKIVDIELAKFDWKTRQTSSYESRGFKKCYFHP